MYVRMQEANTHTPLMFSVVAFGPTVIITKHQRSVALPNIACVWWPLLKPDSWQEGLRKHLAALAPCQRKPATLVLHECMKACGGCSASRRTWIPSKYQQLQELAVVARARG